MKEGRQRAILRILGRNKVRNQEELLEYLRNEGIVATQATVSRDLAQMNIVKLRDENSGSSFFSVPSNFLHVIPDANKSVSGIVSVEISGQICVIKTSPGYANMVGAVIDSKCSGHSMGTIAGDDTLLVMLRQNIVLEDFINNLEQTIPGISSKYI